MGSACSDGIEEYGGVLRHKRGPQPAVGQFPGQFKAFRAQRCQVDRDVWPGSSARNQSLALSTRQGKLVDLTLVNEALTARHHAHNVNHFSQSLKGPGKPHTVPALHNLWPTHTKPKHKATSR